MASPSRNRNMSRIFLVFAVVCLVLAGALFVQLRDLEQQLRALTVDVRQVEQTPQIVRKQLRRTRVLVWAAGGGAVLLAAAAVLAGRSREGAS